MDRRTFIGFLLIGLIVFIWMSRVQSRVARQAREADRVADSLETRGDTIPAAASPKEITPEPEEPATPSAEAAAPALPPKSDVPLQDAITIRAPDLKYETVWSNRGACLRELRLTDYKQELDGEEGILLLAGAEDEAYCTLVLQDPKGILPLDTQHYEILEKSERRIAFTALFENGLRITKEFRLEPDKYELGVRISFKNEGETAQMARYRILASARLVPEGSSAPDIRGAIGYLKNSERVVAELRRARPKGRILNGLPLARHSNEKEPVLWVGTTNRYFAGVLIPVVPEGGSAHDIVGGASVTLLPDCDTIKRTARRVSRTHNALAALLLHPKELHPGQELTHEYTYFVGPKKKEILADYPGIAGVLDYGWFGFISKLLLVILHFFHRLIPNYGVGIILLTILVKVCLFPMTRKGQLAMHKMQKLQPLIRELQEKHKSDKQRLGKEQMELFRKHGANPMSGCMPIFFQFPVFIGLFRMLQNSVDLRHEGFMLWIRDLSRPDTIGHLGGFAINILPVLMVISWLIQQRTMPKPSDPQQAQTQKMMRFMPIFFGFILYGMASGLVLYWLTSTFLGIIEQKLVKLQIKKMEEEGKFAAAEARPSARRSRHPKSRRR